MTLLSLPKIDLHRHLEGSLRLATLAEVAREHNVDLPSYDIEQLRPYVQITNDEPDFHGFLAKFTLLRRFYSTRQAVARVAYEAVADAVADNVRYLELRFCPATLAEAQGFTLSDVTDWVCQAIQQACQDFPITVKLILCLVRERDLPIAETIVDLAIAGRERGIVGVDLAGDEVRYPAAPFQKAFLRAAEAGLGITIHAGEVTHASSVRMAIEELGAQRIGHGVRIASDPEVIELIRSRGVALEMCPTSNIQTAAVRNLMAHPLGRLHRHGVMVTINTDDPSVSNTTLTDEYLVAIRGIGLTLSELKETIMNAARAAFLPPNEKESLVSWFEHALYPLGE